MAARVLAAHGTNPDAVTRRIEFREAEGRVLETATNVNGKRVVDLNTVCPDEASFRKRLKTGGYEGEVRTHTVDGARILFLEDPRRVVLTTDRTRVV